MRTFPEAEEVSEMGLTRADDCEERISRMKQYAFSAMKQRSRSDDTTITGMSHASMDMSGGGAGPAGLDGAGGEIGPEAGGSIGGGVALNRIAASAVWFVQRGNGTPLSRTLHTVERDGRYGMESAREGVSPLTAALRRRTSVSSVY
jgi:hypothetical protein